MENFISLKVEYIGSQLITNWMTVRYQEDGSSSITLGVGQRKNGAVAIKERGIPPNPQKLKKSDQGQT